MTESMHRFGMLERVLLFAVLSLVSTLVVITSVAVIAEHGGFAPGGRRAFEILSSLLLGMIAVLCLGRPLGVVLRIGIGRAVSYTNAKEDSQ